MRKRLLQLPCGVGDVQELAPCSWKFVLDGKSIISRLVHKTGDHIRPLCSEYTVGFA